MEFPWAYFDTSAYIKAFIEETGSQKARKLLMEHRPLVSALVQVECISVLSRKREEGGLSNDGLTSLLFHMKATLAHAELMRLSDEVMLKTETVIIDSAARTLDALHIASALLFKENTGVDLAFVTSDMKQKAAAEKLGLRVVFAG